MQDEAPCGLQESPQLETDEPTVAAGTVPFPDDSCDPPVNEAPHAVPTQSGLINMTSYPVPLWTW